MFISNVISVVLRREVCDAAVGMVQDDDLIDFEKGVERGNIGQVGANPA